MMNEDARAALRDALIDDMAEWFDRLMAAKEGDRRILPVAYIEGIGFARRAAKLAREAHGD